MMRPADVLGYVFGALRGYKLRSGLVLLAMAIGVASVLLLTALGEGARIFVDGEFRSLGTHLLVILPGRSETKGAAPPLLGETPRDLTLADAEALRRCRGIRHIAPVAFGTAPVSVGAREREMAILGTTWEMLHVRHLTLGAGNFLPEMDSQHADPICVVGLKARKELFGAEPCLGRWLRVGDRRFRVIGVLNSKGRSIGLDLDEMVVLPVASAMALFDTHSLFRVMIEARSSEAIEGARRCVIDTLRLLHEGEDDVTVITQDAVLGAFNKILTALTASLGGIAAVSLGVAGILIMNVLLVSVSERRGEVGLLKALGAPPRQIVTLFIAEALCLAGAGAAIGLAAGSAGIAILAGLYPRFPVTAPSWAPAAAVALALAAGLVFGVVPASRAARLDPVLALSRR